MPPYKKSNFKKWKPYKPFKVFKTTQKEVAQNMVSKWQKESERRKKE